MQVIHPRCAGLDVHQKTVVVTVMITHQDGTVHRAWQTVSTMTADLLALDDWLRQRQVGPALRNKPCSRKVDKCVNFGIKLVESLQLC
jgi:hypothetical protein